MRLLVASHDASRTGAPLVLLTFLRWLSENTDSQVQLVLWRGGPLVEDFRAVADTTVLHPPPGERSAAETVELALAKARLTVVADRVTAFRVRRRLTVAPHDVLYLNGAGSALVAPHLDSTAPAVAHVHELQRGLTFSLRGPGRQRVLGADRVVAVSSVVADLLVGQWGVDPERVVVQPGAVPDRDAPPATADRNDPPLVLSVGTGSWRKGIDLFVRVAAAVREARGEGVRFAWVGPLDDEAAVRAQAAELSLRAALELPGEVEDPTPWYQRASVFVSTAREDPFPLVALEAGAAGLPVAGFAAGGLAELLADGRGVVVPPEDVDALADQVLALLDTGGGDAGQRLQAHVRAHHTPAVVSAALWAHVQAVAAG